MKVNETYDEKGRAVVTISMLRVNRFALTLLIPIVLVFGLPYYLLWGENAFLALRFKSLLFLFLFVVLGIVIHELLHGIVWALMARGGFRSIRFGIKWEYLTPYCHCKVPLRVWQYIAGGAAPLLFMGIMPAIWALFKGNTLMMFYGIFFTWTAAGDIMAIWLLSKYKPMHWITDHPSELGFIIE